MKASPGYPTRDGPLLGLAYELLDAHLDTVELMDLTDDFRWRVHLDYLRALVRKSEELLAEALASAPTAAAEAAARGRQIQ